MMYSITTLLSPITLVLWPALYHYFLSSSTSSPPSHPLFSSIPHHLLPETCCRLVTLIHAVVATLTCALSAFICGPFPITEPGGVNTGLEEVIMVCTLSYFTFDIIWCLLHGTEGVTMFLHHVVSVCGLTCSLYSGVSGAEVIGVIGGSEITNPLLQCRWLLRSSGQHALLPARYEAIELAFCVMFGVIRCGVGSYFLYSHLTHPRPSAVFRLGGVVMYLLSWAFFLQILAYAHRKYSRVWREMGTERTLANFYSTLIDARRRAKQEEPDGSNSQT